ncbi:MAG: hypothetical protein H6819_09575 [Phycisphaerales bacterium]|nr:hypothetical protein [Phycisphaerales bacterium]MCB9855474.1 hypothetical protein [Phycisphaerales bacterium]MCB9864251.1 hypothetical protein [Phycisphaerales bacterium]
MSQLKHDKKDIRTQSIAEARSSRRPLARLQYPAWLAAVCMAIATHAVAQTVTVSLESPQNGTFVQAGETIDWSISVSVSSGDNHGLAFFCADLVQSETNPATLEIPHADGIPSEMMNFSSPAGVSNPPDVGMSSGYVGTQVGDAGGMNLHEIGGGQNLFGEALPAATGLAQSAGTIPGVGQAGGIVIASGSFTAPATEGAYTFELRNVLANVLSEANPQPRFSLARAANVDLAAGTLTITVSDGCDPFDVNCDGAVDGRDVQPLVSSLLTHTPSSCSPCAGDTDANGATDMLDIQIFVDRLLR